MSTNTLQQSCVLIRFHKNHKELVENLSIFDNGYSVIITISSQINANWNFTCMTIKKVFCFSIEFS